MNNWQENILNTPEQINALLQGLKTVAVLGIKPEEERDKAAFYVPYALQNKGVKVIPVPVFYPEVTDILGEKVYRKLADIKEPVDIVNIFRKPKDIPAHLDDILAIRPRAVWMQLGIHHPLAAEILAKSGILVVQDRCLMVEYCQLN